MLGAAWHPCWGAVFVGALIGLVDVAPRALVGLADVLPAAQPASPVHGLGVFDPDSGVCRERFFDLRFKVQVGCEKAATEAMSDSVQLCGSDLMALGVRNVECSLLDDGSTSLTGSACCTPTAETLVPPTPARGARRARRARARD